MADNIKKISPDNIELYKQMFELMDADQDGQITAEEYHAFLEKVNEEGGLSKEEISDLLQETDCDGDEHFQFDDFLSIIGNKIQENPSQEDAATIFKKFDLNNEKKIGRDVLKQIMEQVGEPLDDKELDSIFAELDSNKTGFLEPKEFLALVNYGKTFSDIKSA